MEKLLNLDAEKILNQEFDIDFKGYSPEQVDHMLDLVIEDYRVYEKAVYELELKVAALQEDNDVLKKQLIEEQGKNMARENADPLLKASGNVDILKRLSRLERQVFDEKNRQ